MGMPIMRSWNPDKFREKLTLMGKYNKYQVHLSVAKTQS
jgi:hypothetical protein